MFRKIGLFVLITFIVSCGQKQKNNIHTISEIENAFDCGSFTCAKLWSDSLIRSGRADSTTSIRLKSRIDLADRISFDFSLGKTEIDSRLRSEFKELSTVERNLWEDKNWLEYTNIDGEKRYFKRAVSNLKLILKNRGPFPTFDQSINGQDSLCLDHSRKVIASAQSFGKPVLPVKMNVRYQLTLKPDAVPDGEIVRCWLPWPHENHIRQTGVKLLKTVPSIHFIAADTIEQRSVYLEQRALKGKPVVFDLQFEYVSMAQYYDLKRGEITPVDTNLAVSKKYTAEQYPQIVFTNEIKHLSDSIVKGCQNQEEKVRKLYYWINDHIIWTGALEYSIIPFIPGYVLKNGRGDCGMQTLLFMTMARYQHIPVKWQSGWMMHPNNVNLHDWCEVFYPGIGWVPLDISFNLQKSGDRRQKEFYITGIDSYRLIINDGIGTSFVPSKKFARSEPYDFQRGELEWGGGNLYFDQWDYQMNVTYN